MSADADLTELSEELIEHAGALVDYFPIHGTQTQIYGVLERNNVEVETENGSVVVYDTVLHVKASDVSDHTESDEFEIDGQLYGVARVLGDEHGVKIMALVVR